VTNEKPRLRAEPIGGSRRPAGRSGTRRPATQTDPVRDPRSDDSVPDDPGAADSVPDDPGTADSTGDHGIGGDPDDPGTTPPGEIPAEEADDPDSDDEPVSTFFTDRPEHGRTTRARRARGCLAVVVALFVLVVGGVFAWHRASGLYDQLTATPDYTTPHGTADVTLTVPRGAAVSDIGDRLHRKHIVKSTKAFDQAVRHHSGTVTVQAGSYRMRTHVPAKTALHRLLHPATYRMHTTVRIKEGLSLSKQVAALAHQSKISRKSYRTALAHPKRLDLPTWAKNRPQGFLYPDSYEISKKPTATSVLRQMTDEFTNVAAEVNLSGRAHKMHYSQYQVLIVASLIEAEVKRPADRAKVARVIYNRLAKKKKLQLDSTVHYAVGKADKVTTTAHDRESQSAYNTYKHKGLPPRPINSPGKAALKAAAYPAHGKWLYFVTVDPHSGKTLFAKDAKHHHTNVEKFRKWCKKHHKKC
jgi:UPF0755 protein